MEGRSGPLVIRELIQNHQGSRFLRKQALVQGQLTSKSAPISKLILRAGSRTLHPKFVS